jgi:acetoin utilization deacetylase AcuC-like enzyme
LNESFLKVKPDFIVYNAGTDILKGDPLGLLSITPEASFSLITYLNNRKSFGLIIITTN